MNANQKAIFPKEIVEFSLENFLYKKNKKSSVIYLIIAFSVITIGFSLPFIQLPVTVNTAGTIQSYQLKQQVFSPISGRIIHFNIEENAKVNKGDLLVELDHSQLSTQLMELEKRKSTVKDFIHDLEILTVSNSLLGRKNIDQLKSPLYIQSLNLYNENLKDAQNGLLTSELKFKRDSILFVGGVLSKADYESIVFSYQQAQSKINILQENTLSLWMGDLQKYRIEILDLENRALQLNEQLLNYKIFASQSGYLQNVMGLQAGGILIANQKLCDIIPDGELIAECYLSPSDIGLISVGQKVKFRVDAFNYQQWGILEGEVVDISKDVFLLNEQHAVFKVRCQLDKDYLTLKTGYKGHLRRGMSMQANFMVTERTIWQLLFDKMDNWLNPKMLTK